MGARLRRARSHLTWAPARKQRHLRKAPGTRGRCSQARPAQSRHGGARRGTGFRTPAPGRRGLSKQRGGTGWEAEVQRAPHPVDDAPGVPRARGAAGRTGWAGAQSSVGAGRAAPRSSHTPGIRAPVHGVDLGQVPPQRPPGAHLDSSHWVDVVRDLKNKSHRNEHRDEIVLPLQARRRPLSWPCCSPRHSPGPTGHQPLPTGTSPAPWRAPLPSTIPQTLLLWWFAPLVSAACPLGQSVCHSCALPCPTNCSLPRAQPLPVPPVLPAVTGFLPPRQQLGLERASHVTTQPTLLLSTAIGPRADPTTATTRSVSALRPAHSGRRARRLAPA